MNTIFQKFQVFLLGLAVIAIFAVPASAANNLYEQFGVTPPITSKQAPDFELKDLQGKTLSLKDFRGKAVLLHFWATWCEPCQAELPTIQNLKDMLGETEIEIVTINIDRYNEDRVHKWVKDYKLKFTVLLDPGQTVRRKYFIMGLPTSYLIDSKGMLRGYISGARKWDSLISKKILQSLSNLPK